MNVLSAIKGIADILEGAKGKITAAPHLLDHSNVQYKGIEVMKNGSIIVYFIGLHSDDIPSNHKGIRRRKLNSLPSDIIVMLYKSLTGTIKHYRSLRMPNKHKQLRLEL